MPFASRSSCRRYSIVRAVAACVRCPTSTSPGLGVLLQACRDVDRVAADHQLPASSGVPAGDDLARVDADPEADLRAVPALDALREGAEAVAHGERSPNGALGVVLVRLRDAEDGEHGVAGELLGRAAEALDLGVDQVEELPWSSRKSSGSSSSPSAVEPARSAKRTVTTRRSCRSSAASAARRASWRRAKPQEEQKAAAAGCSAPQLGQVR